MDRLSARHPKNNLNKNRTKQATIYSYLKQPVLTAVGFFVSVGTFSLCAELSRQADVTDVANICKLDRLARICYSCNIMDDSPSSSYRLFDHI